MQVSATSENAEDSTAYRDDLDSEIPNSCAGKTYLASDSVRSSRDPDNIDSPLFGSDSSPSSPPSSPSSLSSPPPSSVMAATAPFENEMPIVVVDKKRKLEVHISDPEYERLPGAEIVKVSTAEYFRKIDDHKRKTQITIRCLRDKVERLEKELSITENSFKVEKEEAVSRVRNFWRNLIEGDTHGGKMVQAARKRAACSFCVIFICIYCSLKLCIVLMYCLISDNDTVHKGDKWARFCVHFSRKERGGSVNA